MAKRGGKISPATEFKPGQSGNPNGRPKKPPELVKLLADVLGEEKDGLTAAEAILKALRMKAVKGDIRAAEVLLDRAYGKAKQSVDHTTKGEKILTPVTAGTMTREEMLQYLDGMNDQET